MDFEHKNDEWQLAEINVGRLVAPEGDPRVKPFFDALDRINALADSSPGFVWRLQGKAGNATDIQPTEDPLFLVNLSVWSDANALFNFVYRSAHTPVMAQRRQYFEPFAGAYQALWWIPAGHRPSVDEGLSRLWRLDRYGPTSLAFTFKARFPAPGVTGLPVDASHQLSAKVDANADVGERHTRRVPSDIRVLAASERER